MQPGLPENSFRAFLHCLEMEHFLEILEKHNFNVFDREVQSQHYKPVARKMSKAARQHRFLLNLMDPE